MSDTDTITHEPDKTRWVLRRGDRELGEAVYELRPDGAFIFTHTEIDPEVDEHGLGTKLVAAALDDIRETTDARVAARCPFVTAFLEKHPEYQDLTTR